MEGAPEKKIKYRSPESQAREAIRKKSIADLYRKPTSQRKEFHFINDDHKAICKQASDASGQTSLNAWMRDATFDRAERDLADDAGALAKIEILRKTPFTWVRKQKNKTPKGKE
jgi:hypothetical protein